jgi:quercetin dioxygenase-like cupin family protein
MRPLQNLLSHTMVAAAAAILAAFATAVILTGQSDPMLMATAHAQASGSKSTEVLTQTMADIAREMRISVTERAPGNSSSPHRHPGHHTFGYVLEGTYEIQVDDGPVRQLKAGESFYEPPGSLHAVSRNPSSDRSVRYLVIQVGDPTKPRTVPQ